MPRMINKETNQFIEVPPGEVLNAYNSGNFGFEQGQQINVLDPDGNSGTLPAENFEMALQRGYSLETDEQINERALQAKFGEGAEQQVKAVIEAGARGLTFGLSDIALPAITGVSKEALRERKERFKKTAIAGEITGAVAPIIASGGTSLFGKAASKLPTAFAAQLSTRAEKKIAAGIIKREVGKRVLAGANLAKDLGIAQKLLPKAIVGAGEGGVYGLGHLTSESSLGNTDFTAENVISHVGMGAILGGSMATTFALPKELIGKVPIPSLPPIAKTMKDLEDLFTLKSTGAMKPQINKIKAQNIAGGSKEKVAEVLRRRKIVRPAASYESTQERAISELKKAGKELDITIKELDDAALAQGIEPQFDVIWKQVEDDIIQPLLDSDLGPEEQMGKFLRNAFKKFQEKWAGKPIPIGEVIKQRRRIRRMAWKGKSKISQDTRGAWLDEVGKKFKQMEEKLADDLSIKTNLGGRYKQAKTDWQVMNWANDALGNKIDSETANLFMSLTDRMATIGTGTASALGAGGLGPGAVAVAAGGGLVSRFLRTRGASIGAFALNKINNLHLINGMNTKATGKIANAVSNFLKKGKGTSIPASTKVFFNTSLNGKKPKKYKNNKEAYLAIQGQLKDLELNIDQTQDMMVNSVEGIKDVAPQTAEKIMQKNNQILNYLNEKKPRDTATVPEVFQRSEYIPNDSEMAKYQRYFAAATQPDSVLDDMEAGRLTLEAVETFREIWPQKFQLLVDEIISQLGSGDVKQSYQKKLELGLMLGVPLTESMQPNQIQFLQSQFVQQQPGQPPTGGDKPKTVNKKGKVDVAGRQQTEIARVNAGGVGG